jgi:hypothetical protein
MDVSFKEQKEDFKDKSGSDSKNSSRFPEEKLNNPFH